MKVKIEIERDEEESRGFAGALNSDVANGQ